LPGIDRPRAFVIWCTGLSGAGKTTLCNSVATKLKAYGLSIQILDGDEMRGELCSDLGFTLEDRAENIRRLIHVSNILVQHGIIVLVAAITPLRDMRKRARAKLERMIEVFVSAPLEICEARDNKGLYKKARSGTLNNFTGITAEYEPPLAPDVVCHTDRESVSESTEKVVMAALNIAFRRPTADRREIESETRSEQRSIAVDLDGVIANYDGWQGRDIIGRPRKDVAVALRTLKAEGWKIIVHTTRCALDIVPYLLKADIPFDEINHNSDKPTLGTKPYASVYWDDRAVRYSGDAQKDLDSIRHFRTWNGRT
jgi:adenylylsulfate kinase